MSFALNDIIKIVDGEIFKGLGGPQHHYSSVTSNSKDSSSSTIFVAIRGHKSDGNKFAQEAVSNGATLVISDQPTSILELNCTVIKVHNSRLALALLASRFAGTPSDSMKMIGVTGTNGKTTTHWMIFHLLNSLGIPAMRVGTIGTEAPHGYFIPGNLTTPDPVELHNHLKEGVSRGAKSCVMEVTSVALDQHRTSGINFQFVIFTHLTRDHLDYHGEMEEYFNAKLKLFGRMTPSKDNVSMGIINTDCSYGERILKNPLFSALNLQSFGENSNADWRIEEFRDEGLTSRFNLVNHHARYSIQSPYVGRHNAFNLTGAIVACLSFGVSISEVITAAKDLPPVPGRLQLVSSEKMPAVFVDYAHTPDALEKALRTLRSIATKKLWVVFGCGGDRDRGKRPQMGTIAAEIADYVVITSDNPRTENPNDIIAEVAAGVETDKRLIVDRREAIRYAVTSASPDDVVLIAGKGHEDYQIIGEKKVHFSDFEEANASLNQRDPTI